LSSREFKKTSLKKKSGAEYHEKGVKEFFKLCFDALLTVDLEAIKGIIIASPGYVKDEFFKYVKEES